MKGEAILKPGFVSYTVANGLTCARYVSYDMTSELVFGVNVGSLAVLSHFSQ